MKCSYIRNWKRRKIIKFYGKTHSCFIPKIPILMRNTFLFEKMQVFFFFLYWYVLSVLFLLEFVLPLILKIVSFAYTNMNIFIWAYAVFGIHRFRISLFKQFYFCLLGWQILLHPSHGYINMKHLISVYFYLSLCHRSRWRVFNRRDKMIKDYL